MPQSRYEKVASVEHLRELARGENQDFFILLAGNCRSSKRIYYMNCLFYVVNEIDDTDEWLTEEELFTHSNIGDAIDRGSFYCDHF